MQWGETKMSAKEHKDECAKLESILEPFKSVEKFPYCFAKDNNNPDKVTIDKIGLMNTKAFGKYTRNTFAQQVVTQGKKILRQTEKKVS